MTFAVLGLGSTGSRIVEQLAATADDLIERTVRVQDLDPRRVQTVLAAQPGVIAGSQTDGSQVVILAMPGGLHVPAARSALRRGAHVVSVSDHPDDVMGLLALDELARDAGRALVVGAGFAPGLTCLLARHAGNALDVVEELSIAKAGTGGPACARQLHRALKRHGREWIDGSWVNRRGGSGRELTWFPDPLGARDCYKAWLAESDLLLRVYPEAQRITARMGATRRDRLTSRLPMLRRPHADGGRGGVRVEVRGRRGRSIETIVYGVMLSPSLAAACVAAEVATHLVRSDLPPGSWGLGEFPEPLEFLHGLRARGVVASTYESSR